MKWLLDTNVISESVRDRPNPAVLAWLGRRVPEQMAVSVVTMAELQDGASSAANATRRRQLTQWLDRDFPVSFADRILPLTSEILVDWLRLARKLAAKGMARAAPDLLIGAPARVHALIVVSRSRRAFDGTGVIVYDPWSGETHKMDEP